MNTPEQSGKAPKSIFLLVAAALVIITIIVIGLIFSGMFDPKPLGTLSSRKEINRIIEIDDEYSEPLVNNLDSRDFSVKLSSASVAGSEDVGYGLRIGDSTHHVIVALSPLGYAAIMDNRLDDWPNIKAAETREPVIPIPWQTWPHINSGRESNEIWIDVLDSNLVGVRINGELLWSGEISLAANDTDFWARSFGEPGMVVIATVEIFSDE